MALQVFIGSVVLFAAFSFVVERERVRGGRLFLTDFRNWCDKSILALYRGISNGLEHFVHYIVKLGWYYSLHSVFRTILHVLVAAYDYVELRFERNRDRAKLLRANKESKDSKTSLAAVVAHKEEVSLTAEEGEALKKEKLEDLD